MNNEKLAQGVKELRKGKGFSQEELAKNSGLSLRTIQRLENGETEPTGETIKRVSTILNVTPNELINWENKKEILKKTVKTKYEYLHIFDNKLIITNTPKIENLVKDYQKSVNNIFKTLMVFFIFIPIFTILILFFYNLEKVELSIYVSGMTLIFLTAAFYSMLFTSGSSSIERDKIKKIKIQRKLFNNIVVIILKESGRLKKRALIIEKNKLDLMKDILLSEKLIENKNIKIIDDKINILGFAIAFIILPNFVNYMYNWDKTEEILMYYGFFMIIISLSLLVNMVIKLINPSFLHKQQTANTV